MHIANVPITIKTHKIKILLAYFIVPFIIILTSLLVIRHWLICHSTHDQTTYAMLEEISQLVTLGFWEVAEKDLKALIQNNLGGVTARILHAQVLHGTKRLTEALSAIEDALNLYSNDLGLIHERARIFLEIGDPKSALESLEQCIPILRSEDEILDLTTALFQNNKIRESWNYLNDFIHQSCNGRLLALAGDCQFHWKNYREALKLYNKAQECGWDNHQILSRIGYCLTHIGEWEEAKECFHAILKHDSADISAILGLGTCFEIKGRFQKALILYQNSNAWECSNPYILRQAGICAVYTGRHEYATLYLQEALKKGLCSPQILAFLGYSLENQKDWAIAEKVYFKLVKRYPRHPAGYVALAWLYGVGLSKNIDAGSGLSMAQRAMELRPDTISWELLSACEARAGNFTKAHNIQEYLSLQAVDKITRMRRKNAMRTLRKKIPLDENHICRILVA